MMRRRDLTVRTGVKLTAPGCSLIPKETAIDRSRGAWAKQAVLLQSLSKAAYLLAYLSVRQSACIDTGSGFSKIVDVDPTSMVGNTDIFYVPRRARYYAALRTYSGRYSG